MDGRGAGGGEEEEEEEREGGSTKSPHTCRIAITKTILMHNDTTRWRKKKTTQQPDPKNFRGNAKMEHGDNLFNERKCATTTKRRGKKKPQRERKKERKKKEGENRKHTPR
jgi:hypothetical protein